MASNVTRPMGPSTRTAELLTLLQWSGVGPVTARKLLVQRKESESLLETARRYRDQPSERAERISQGKAARILEACASHNLCVIGIEDEEFPSLLRSIPDPPPIIYVRGDVQALSLKAVAVVGTRKVSEEGKRIARMISRFLARKDVSVVSGLALGTDTMAHIGALEGEGVTVAVMAHGLDIVAPSSNRDLAEEIVRKRGALMSEHPPGVPPRPAEFVRRNRLQSGLSHASIVVESGVTGGAVHQATFAREQGRTLMTVLASDARAGRGLNEAGARHLIEELNAIPIRGTRELWEMLERLRPPGKEPTVYQPEFDW